MKSFASSAASSRPRTPRTRAIIPVHYAGHPCEMDELLTLGRDNDLAIIEDAAHSLPASYRGRKIGSGSNPCAFSFYATKNLTTAEGGMLTADPAFVDRARMVSLHGMSRDAWKRYQEAGSWSYEVLAPGFKYNLSDVAAAIGIPQLRRCNEMHARRREIARRYTEAFAGLSEVRCPATSDDAAHAWHLYVLQLELDRLKVDRDEFIRGLVQRKIGVSVHFIPLHIQPYYRDRYGYAPNDFPNAFGVFQRILSLPIYAKMTDDDIEDVIAAVIDTVEASRR